MACAQKPPMAGRADISSGTRYLGDFGWSIHLHLYFMYAINEGPGANAHMRRLTRVIVAQNCGKCKIYMLAQMAFLVRKVQFTCKPIYALLNFLPLSIRCIYFECKGCWVVSVQFHSSIVCTQIVQRLIRRRRTRRLIWFYIV